MKRLVFFLLAVPVVLFPRFTSAHEPNNVLIQGVDFYHKGDYHKALKTLKICVRDAEQAADTQCLILAFRNLGNVYSRLGQAIEALQTYQQSVRLAEALGEHRVAAHSLMNIGALYEEQRDFEKALVIYDDVEALALFLNDSSILADCANNKGVIYEQQGHYTKALQAYRSALGIYEGMGNEERIGLTLNNIGIVYKFLGDYRAAIGHYQRSLTLAEEMGDRFLAAANLTNMGNVFLLMEEYPQAIAHHRRSLEIATEIDAVQVIVEAYSSLAEVYAKSDDYKKAYDYHQRYVQLHDTLLNKERLRQIAEIQTKYETENKEQEIAALKQATDIQMMQLQTQQLLLQRRNLQILAISIVVLLGGTIAFLLYSRQQLKERQLREKAVLDAEYRERVRIARDMHDDLGAGLSRISLAADLADRKSSTDQDTKNNIRYIGRVSKELVDNMRDLIWILNPEHANLDQVAVRIREFCGDYLEESGVNVLFEIQHDLPAVPVSRELQRNVFLTVKEAAHNIVKHAGAQTVQISLLLTTDNELSMTIRDDGQGFDPGAVKTTGNGLRNMEQRIETLGGRFHLSSAAGKGTEVEIVVPLAAAHLQMRSKQPAK